MHENNLINKNYHTAKYSYDKLDEYKYEIVDMLAPYAYY